MKKFFVLLVSVFIFLTASSNNPVKIDEQLLQSFAAQFPNAQKVVWQELEEAYTVSFVEDEIRVRVVYLRNGALTHFLRYYLEESLPLHIRLTIKEKFPGQDIHGVIEENLVSHIENRTKTTYYVRLENETSWSTVKIEKGRKMKVIDRLTKQF